MAGILIKISCHGVTQWQRKPFLGSTATSSPAQNNHVSTTHAHTRATNPSDSPEYSGFLKNSYTLEVNEAS